MTNQIYRLLRNYNVIRVGREVENQLEYIKVNTTHIRIEKDWVLLELNKSYHLQNGFKFYLLIFKDIFI